MFHYLNSFKQVALKSIQDKILNEFKNNKSKY